MEKDNFLKNNIWDNASQGSVHWWSLEYDTSLVPCEPIIILMQNSEE